MRFKDLINEAFLDWGTIADDLRMGKTSGVTADGDYWELEGDVDPKSIADKVEEGEESGDGWSIVYDENTVTQTLDYDEVDERALALVRALDEDDLEVLDVEDGYYGRYCYKYAGAEYRVLEPDEASDALRDYIEEDLAEGYLSLNEIEGFIDEDYWEDEMEEDFSYLWNEKSEEEKVEFLHEKNYMEYCEHNISEDEYDPDEYEGLSYEEFLEEQELEYSEWTIKAEYETEAEELYVEYQKDYYANSFEWMREYYNDEDLIKRAYECGAIDVDELVDDWDDEYGRGSRLASYDGDELEGEVDGTTYYCYRVD